jgi:polar amino acid transport system substrate-binding protein
MNRFLARVFATCLFGSALAAQTLTIYTEISPPAQFLGSDGKLTGCSYDLVREIQRRLGSSEPIEVVPWVRGFGELQTRPNVVLFSVARSEERDPLFHWVGPIRENTYSFFARKDSKLRITTLEEARRIGLIGVYKEDMRDQYLTRLGFTNLDRSLDNVIPFKKLLAGRIDCIVTTRSGLAELAHLAGAKVKDFREVFPFLKVQLYIAFSKATPETVVQAWATALEGMKKDGTFERIYRKYPSPDPLPGPPVKPF